MTEVFYASPRRQWIRAMAPAAVLALGFLVAAAILAWSDPVTAMSCVVAATLALLIGLVRGLFWRVDVARMAIRYRDGVLTGELDGNVEVEVELEPGMTLWFRYVRFPKWGTVADFSSIIIPSLASQPYGRVAQLLFRRREDFYRLVRDLQSAVRADFGDTITFDIDAGNLT